jgi:hypothetical protein
MATDADEHKLTFSVVNAPPFASFSPSTGKLSGVPHTEQARVYSNIVISVTDGTNRVSLPAFSLVVEPTAKQPPATVPTPDSLESSNSAHDGSGSMPPPQSTAIGQDDPYVPTEESADNDAQEGSGTTGAVTLSWTPPTSNADGSALTDLAGYRIVYGRDEGALTETIEVRNPGISNYVVENLSGGTWYFGLKTYNTNGSEGPLSRVVTRIVQ